MKTKCVDVTQTEPQPLEQEEKNKSKRPLIGILAERRKASDKDRGVKKINSVNVPYVEAIELAGGVPVIIPFVEEFETIIPLLDTLQGILAPGGSNLDPMLYGEAPSRELGPMDPVLDRHLYLTVEYAIRNQIPILGICKGMQLVNAVMCGSTYQDLSHRDEPSISHMQSIDRALPHHEVQIEPGSTLHRILGQDTVRVNSFHHQCIKDLAPGLKVTARAEDGIIEGVEGSFMPVFCVQWHPEELIRVKDSGMLRIFKYFVAMTKDNSGTRG